VGHTHVEDEHERARRRRAVAAATAEGPHACQQHRERSLLETHLLPPGNRRRRPRRSWPRPAAPALETRSRLAAPAILPSHAGGSSFTSTHYQGEDGRSGPPVTSRRARI